MLAMIALVAPSTPRLAPLNATDTLRVQLEREVQTLGRPDPPGGTAGGYRRTTKTVDGEVRRSGGTEEAASVTSKLRSAVAADVQRMLTDVERMGKTEEDEMSMLRTKAHVLQRVENGLMVAPRLGSPASSGRPVVLCDALLSREESHAAQVAMEPYGYIGTLAQRCIGTQRLPTLSSRTLNTQVLERTVRERDDELRDARPRIQALEAELASMRDETDGLRKANAKLKGHLGTVRRSLQIDLSPEAMSDL